MLMTFYLLLFIFAVTFQCIVIFGYRNLSNQSLSSSSKRTEKVKSNLKMWPFQSNQKVESLGIPIIDAVLSKNIELIKSMDSNSDVINQVDPATGNNALHIIAKKGHYQYPPQEIPKLLIEKGIDINRKNLNDKTALEISLLSGWQKISMLLLDNGADRSVVTQDVVSKITCPDCKRVVREYNLLAKL